MSATPDLDTKRQWSDDDSTTFIEVGAVYTPSRDELTQTVLDLIPADVDEPFVAVELGVGSGWLSAAILQRFPAARIVGLDGSPTMLRETEQRLLPYAGRYTLRPFRLEDSAWLESTPELTGADVRCFVSSLVIHHLDSAGKRELYQRLYAQLAAGGALNCRGSRRASQRVGAACAGAAVGRCGAEPVAPDDGLVADLSTLRGRPLESL